MQMEETLVESAHLFVKDLDEIIVDRETVKHDQIMFKHHMRLLDDRFHAESCNILYCDLDVVFTRPFHIFGQILRVLDVRDTNAVYDTILTQ